MKNHIDNFLNVLSKMGFTYNKIHESTGISKISLSKWRNGDSEPKHDSLLKLKDFALEILTMNGLNFPLKKEFKEPLENFYKYADSILQEMPKKNDKESIILSDHKNNPEAQEALKPFLDFGLFDFYLNTDNENGFLLENKTQISRKIKKEYKQNFVHNFNRLIEYIDNNLVEKSDDMKWISDSDEDDGLFVSDKKEKIAETWLAKKLDVSRTQIIHWKSGKDFPTEENLDNLKALLHLNGRAAFLGYELLDEQFERIFLSDLDDKLKKENDDYLYHETLEFFTKVLFFYCRDFPIVQKLKDDMERSLTEEIEENIVQAFFREIYCLKISRGYTLDDNTKERLPELVSYIEMSNEQINYILRKDKEVLNRIFTNETIKLLREVSGNPYFDEEQREQLEELISLLEHRKGVKVPYLKFRLLYSPDEHSPEDIEEITDNLALLLTAPSIFKWFHSEYSFDSLTDKELNEVMGFANLALLNNNQELREKVKRYAIEKLGSKTDLPYSDLLIFFDDLSVQSVIERIFYRK